MAIDTEDSSAYPVLPGTFSSVRVAAISLKPTRWDKAANADKLEHFFRQAARTRARLLVATEGALEGYVVMDVVRDPAKAERMLEIAEPINGPYVRRFQSLARSLRTCLAFGFAERIRNEVYNAAAFIDHRGRIVGKQHKSQLAEGLHPSWYFNRAGEKLRAFNTPLGRAGFLICNDRWNPNIARTLVLDGAQMLLICSYGSRKKRQNQNVLARARENGVPIVEANVGVNLIVSRGEAVAYKWGVDRITTATIDIPVRPSTQAARAAERVFLRWRGPEMRRRYRKMMQRIKKERRSRRATH